MKANKQDVVTLDYNAVGIHNWGIPAKRDYTGNLMGIKYDDAEKISRIRFKCFRQKPSGDMPDMPSKQTISSADIILLIKIVDKRFYLHKNVPLYIRELYLIYDEEERRVELYKTRRHDHVKGIFDFINDEEDDDDLIAEQQSELDEDEEYRIE